MGSFFNSMAISSSGLKAQRIRMNLLSSNLANAQTTRTPEGGPYKRKDAIFSATPVDDLFANILGKNDSHQLRKVQVTGIHQDQNDPKRIFDPSHADADKDGYVQLPNIQIMNEMVNMITATRAYEANTTALNAAKSMALKALEIGR